MVEQRVLCCLSGCPRILLPVSGGLLMILTPKHNTDFLIWLLWHPSGLKEVPGWQWGLNIVAIEAGLRFLW